MCAARILADGLSLDIPIHLQHERSSRAWMPLLLGAAFDPPRRKVQNVISHVSFELRSGERLAIFGRNGAGKSTLLRILNGAYAPTRGRLEIKGTKQSLLNISLGFNPEATLKENILLRGAAMGLPGKRLAEQMEDILEFAGIAEKANHRLKTLSTGQRMRLGFAISTSVQHDIMLMDEWVGTGDSEFLAKAKERLLGRVEGSQIVVLASHNLNLARDICNKGLVLERGRVIHFGDVGDAIVEYNRLMAHSEPGFAAEQAKVQQSLQRFIGSVDVLELEHGRLVVKGWAVADLQRAPRMLRITVQGRCYDVVQFDRFARPDVQKHLGLGFSLCGYVAAIDGLAMDSVRELGGDFSVAAGDGPSDFGPPMHMATSVLRQIEY